MINKIKEWSGVIALIAIVLFFIFGGKTGGARFGGVTNYDEIDTTALKIGGTNGTRVGPIIATTCTNVIGNTSITASTTAAFDCAVTGVVSGDYVIAEQATTSQAYLGMSIIGANASTTSGFVTIRVSNPGATAVLPYAIASSTTFLIFHPVSTVPGL